MSLFGLFGPNIDSMMKKGDVNGLIRLLGSKDPVLRKKAAEFLASLLALIEKPETLDDVKKLVGRYAQMFDFEQRGDFVYVKIRTSSGMKLSSREYGQILRRIERVFKEVGGTKTYDKWPLCVPLYKPSHAPLQKGDKRMYLSIDEKEMIAVELGKFGDDLAVKPLSDYASISPLTAIQALSDIGSERAIEALRSMLYNHYHNSAVWARSYWDCDISDSSYEEREMIFALEEAITNYRDYEGSKEIIKAYSKLFDYFDGEERDKSKHLVLRTFKQIIGKNEIRKDRELLMILLKCLGAFPADSSRTWLDNYYEQETDDYGNLQITEKKLIADHIGRYDGSKVIVSDIITLEQFKEYMRNLDLELIKDEEVLNYLVTLIAEYPNTLEGNPIAIALQRIDPKTRILFLNSYIRSCENWLAQGGFSWSPSKERNKPNIFDVIDSLKKW